MWDYILDNILPLIGLGLLAALLVMFCLVFRRLRRLGNLPGTVDMIATKAARAMARELQVPIRHIEGKKLDILLAEKKAKREAANG